MKTVWTDESNWEQRAEALADSGETFEVRGFDYASHVATYAYLASRYRLQSRYDPTSRTATFHPPFRAGSGTDDSGASNSFRNSMGMDSMSPA